MKDVGALNAFPEAFETLARYLPAADSAPLVALNTPLSGLSPLSALKPNECEACSRVSMTPTCTFPGQTRKAKEPEV